MKTLRIVFMGSPDFAVPSLEKLHSSHHNVVAVVTGPDKRRGRGREKSPTAVKNSAIRLGLPVIEVEDLKSADFIQKLKTSDADLFVVVAFRVLPQVILDIPHIGSVNLHASLLPRYRGAAPIHHAVMNGDTETGCTVFFLDEKIDTGNILLQEKTGIGPHENTGSVYERLMYLGADLLLRSVQLIADGKYELFRQDDKVATPAPKIFPDDCRIDFSENKTRIYNKIRGLSPSPGAWAVLDGLRLRIHECRPAGITLPGIRPAQVITDNNKVFAGCADGVVELLKVQLEGKKIMEASEFFRGYKGASVIE
ncbi:MAG: methionyl-tRNA formyltransferase [Rhodothermaceae bacterium]|nr:methionyl-tRNA formyltransferase [Rhodothermaceae bacterium]